jgi:hypothetical protein
MAMGQSPLINRSNPRFRFGIFREIPTVTPRWWFPKISLPQANGATIDNKQFWMIL